MQLPIRHFGLAMVVLVVLASACNPVSTPRAIGPAMSAAALPSLLSPVPTQTSASKVSDYLLNAADLPGHYDRLTIRSKQLADGSVTSALSAINANQTILNQIVVVDRPLGPKDLERSPSFLPFDTPKVGDGAKAYHVSADVTAQNDPTILIFYKGNVLVQVYVLNFGRHTTVNEMVRLARIVEARLPDRVPLLPLAFPTQLDQAAFSKYFKTIALRDAKGDSPATTFATADTRTMCYDIESLTPGQAYATAIYDPQAKTYAFESMNLAGLPPEGVGCDVTFDPLPAGKYEYRFAVGDTLVAVLPFEVQ